MHAVEGGLPAFEGALRTLALSGLLLLGLPCLTYAQQPRRVTMEELRIEAAAETLDSARIRIEGVITTHPRASGNSGFMVYIQDSTGGARLYSRNPALLKDHQIGDVVSVTGGLSSNQGMLQID